jgi:hypothetical protein
MADDKSQRAPQDAARINVHEDYELRYWTKEFGISADELKRLVEKHGVSAKAVREALGNTTRADDWRAGYARALHLGADPVGDLPRGRDEFGIFPFTGFSCGRASSYRRRNCGRRGGMAPPARSSLWRKLIRPFVRS